MVAHHTKCEAIRQKIVVNEEEIEADFMTIGTWIATRDLCG